MPYVFKKGHETGSSMESFVATLGNLLSSGGESEEFTDTLLVFSDFLEDQGDIEGATLARTISRGGFRLMYHSWNENVIWPEPGDDDYDARDNQPREGEDTIEDISRGNVDLEMIVREVEGMISWSTGLWEVIEYLQDGLTGLEYKTYVSAQPIGGGDIQRWLHNVISAAANVR